ncbi:ATP-binding protein [Neisseria leonii]|uniref:ATP-binding protein n=1 Tax=Neisseria leonii TaxID=2995413 RepID=A0A9X4IEW0_9NEIS|nr:ATP-binding protein [Neisseria sp. 51.81]MDD9328528.1 ATP-binding protein [Neisseria sp. 51.81]
MSDPLFFHRRDYAAKLVDTLQAGITHAFTLFAPRRMGKTQFLLQDVRPQAEAAGFNVFYFSFMDSANPAADFQAALTHFAAKIQTGGKAKTLIGQVRKIEIMGVGLDRETAAADTPRLSDIIGLIAADNRPSLLLLDEIQELARRQDTDGLIRSLRTGLDINQAKVKTIFTGSSTNGLRAVFNDNKAPFFHFAHALDFPVLGREFTDFLADICRDRTGAETDKDELYRLFERLHRTPMYLRAVIQDMILNPALSLEAAAQFRLAELNQAQGEAAQWRQMKPLEQTIIKDIARNRNTSPYSQDTRSRYAAALGVEQVGTSSVQGAIRRMMRHDWISRDSSGRLTVNNPLLQTWIIENAE